jgi:hypothetical protein
LIICGRECVLATSNCCNGGASCENGGTFFMRDDGTGACCIPGHTRAAASGSSVVAPEAPTCTGDKPLPCRNSCFGVDQTCCPQGGSCSGDGTCYTKSDGADACCIPGNNCVASGGLTSAVVPTGPLQPSTVTATATARLTAAASPFTSLGISLSTVSASFQR